MARTKQNRQNLGGKLQSARAKHDTALEQEILGQIAAKKSAKAAAKTKKVETAETTDTQKPKKAQNVEKTEKAKSKTKAEGTQTTESKKSERPKKKSKKQKNKEKRTAWNGNKKELTELLCSDLGVKRNEAVEIVTQASTRYTLRQMSEAAYALHESNSGKFTEGEFMTKTEENRKAEELVDIASRKAAKKESKAEKNKASANAGNLAGKKREVVPDLTSGHGLMPPQDERTSDEILDNATAVSKGFSAEFWMDLAGSREAAAVAAD